MEREQSNIIEGIKRCETIIWGSGQESPLLWFSVSFLCFCLLLPPVFSSVNLEVRHPKDQLIALKFIDRSPFFLPSPLVISEDTSRYPQTNWNLFKRTVMGLGRVEKFPEELIDNTPACWESLQVHVTVSHLKPQVWPATRGQFVGDLA